MGKTFVQVSGFRDLYIASYDQRGVHTRWNGSYYFGVLNSNICRCHSIKKRHPLSKQAIIEIVYTTMVHSPVITMGYVTHMSNSLNMNEAAFT